MASPSPAPTGERKWRRRARKACVVALALAFAALAFLAFEALTWPDVAALAKDDPETTAFIERFEKRMRREGRTDAAAWTPVPYARISPHLKHAVVVAEDVDFFSHDGFSRHEIREAWRKAWEQKRLPRGASTITQQLAKNLWLSPSRNPWRKVKEALLTRALERHLEKRRILELYLNVVELGPGVYGAEAASRRYFGKPAASLTEREAAELAASLPRPSTWHPGSSSRGYASAVERVLSRMRRTSWISREI